MFKQINSVLKYLQLNLIQLISGALIVSLILVGTTSWNIWQMYENFNKVVITECNLQELSGKIRYYDEALTMSARMAAATGDLDWKERYLKLETDLNKTIAETIAIAPEAYAPNAIDIETSNSKLLEIEEKAFNLVKQNQKENAFELLFSEKYLFDKQVYSEGIARTIGALDTRVQFNINAYKESLLSSIIYSSINFWILLFIWLFTSGLINWYIKQQEKTTAILNLTKNELKKSNLNLEEQVKLRTVELEKALDKAEKANLAKNNFLANISYELRNPINIILGYTKLMIREREISSVYKEKLRIIHQSSNYLLSTIDNLLDFVSLNSGKIELNNSSVNLKLLLDSCLNIANYWAEEKHLEIKYELNSSLSNYIQVDEKRLQQIILNLLSNAIKFTDNGQIILRITATEVSKIEPQQRILFEIIDTGRGVSEDDLKSIFIPFEQINENGYKSSGNGLGLFLTSKLIELMGGKLQGESQIGKGSRFWFEIASPLIEVPQEQLKVIHTKSREISGYRGKKKQILVADNRYNNYLLLKEILQPLGFQIFYAQNLSQILNLSKLKTPDLILLDFTMLFVSQQPGSTSVKELRKMPENKNTPIFILSASYIAQKASQLLDCDVYISKPIDEENLLNLVKKYLKLEWIYQ